MTTQSATESPPAGRRARFPRGVLVAAVPVVLVNIVAFSGQLAFLRAHLPWPLVGQVTMAVALESIAVYLAYHAHLAQLANDSALRLRLASYAFGLVIGAMNYSHYAGPGWRPTFPAVAIGLMSASSPWLWAIYSRRVSRDALLAQGLIEPHALRLGATRWTWHPARSARVMWQATWEGITDPAVALAMGGPQPRTAPQPRKAPARQLPAAPAAEPPAAGKDRSPAAPVAPGVPMVPVPPVTQLDRRELATAPHNAARIRHAFTVLGDEAAPAAVARELAAAGYPVHAEHVRSIKKRIHHGRPSRAQGPASVLSPAGPRLATATAERPTVPELVPAGMNGDRAAS